MQKQKSKLKYFVPLILMAFIFSSNFSIVQAIGLSNAIPVDNPILAPANADGSALSSILGSALGANVANSLQSVISTINKASCISSDVSKVLDTSKGLGAGSALGAMSLISGGTSDLVTIQTEITLLTGAQKCTQGQLDSLKASSIVSLAQGQIRDSLINNLSQQLSVINLRLNSLSAQQKNAQQGFWKTLVFNILIQTSKSVADALVNKLVNNYKIKNLKQYVDSTATLMYDNQYLRDNFPDAQGQMMSRAILNQPELRGRIQPGIYLAADAALGFKPATLNPNDPNFYQKMAMIGSPLANPYYLQTSYVAGVDQSHAQAIGQAQNMISQSQGYKTPVNCAGSLAQQQQIDLRTKAASDQLDNRRSLLTSLQQAQVAGQNVSGSDLAKAQSDYNNALANWNSIPFSVTGSSSVSSLQQGGGNNTEGSIAITMCEAISSPATLINKGIDQAFNAVGVNMAQYNDNNLPSFISLIGGVASQIGSSLILGGPSAAKNTTLVNENKLLNATVGTVNQTLANNTASAYANSVTFVAVVDANAINSYQFNFNIDTSVVTAADHVNIVGDGISQTIRSTSGSASVTTTKGGNYTLTVFDSGNNVLASSTTTVNPNLNSGNSYASGRSSVGSLTILPSSGSIKAGGTISIVCSGLSSLPSGSQLVVKINGVAVDQQIPITNGQCSTGISISKANNFNSSGSNSINAWVGDVSGSQIDGTPDVTVNLSVTGTVLGAFTDKPSIQIRGPEVKFSLRGE